jgi:hypothetical protein
MLTSERKLHKLFIKFVTWNKVEKAMKLLEIHPLIEFPLQKAFEESTRNKSYWSSKWIYSLAILKNVKIDIHYNNDEFLLDIKTSNNREMLKWIEENNYY